MMVSGRREKEVRLQIRGAAAEVTPIRRDFCHFVASILPGCRPAPLAFGPSRRLWPARRRAAPGWRRPGLAVYLRQTRLADTLLRARSFAVTGQRAGCGGTSSIPHADEIAGHPAGRAAGPNQFERRKQSPAFGAPQNAPGG